jgi:hypothetical protein
MKDYFTSVQSAARFSGDKAGKVDLFRGGRLLAGLNCFEPGQAQHVHTHQGADKFYFLVTGKARHVKPPQGIWSGPPPGSPTGWSRRWSAR